MTEWLTQIGTFITSLHLEDIVGNSPLLLKGLGNTLMLAGLVYVTALLLGLILSLIRYYQVPLLKPIADGYVYGLRSIPLIMLVALIHYGVLPSLGLQYSFFISAFVAFCLSTVAYICEIFRGGFESIRREEVESALSLGLSPWQRFTYVMIPLIFLRILPALINQGITLIKDTSLASIIGVIELTRSAEIIYERTLHEVTLLIFVACVYFLICTTLSQVAKQFEKTV